MKQSLLRVFMIGLPILLISCHSPIKKALTGEWLWLEAREYNLSDSLNTSLSLANCKFPGLRFLSDDSLENPLGFFDYKTLVDSIDTDKPTSVYLGSKTAYKLIGDSLSIFDRTEKKWENFSIVRADVDTLIVRDQKENLIWYASSTAQPKYDAISIASSGCFGSCPVTNLLFLADGQVISFAKHYTKQTGFLKTRIDTTLYWDIVRRFNNASVMKLKAKYEAGHTDDNTITVSFLKNGRIVKTVSDYGYEAPAGFIWAYQYAINSSTLFDYKSFTPRFSPILSGSFKDKWEKRPRTLSLYQSENFLFWNYLNAAQTIPARQEKLPYKLYYLSDYLLDNELNHLTAIPLSVKLPDKQVFNIKEINTDGRYVEFVSIENKKLCIDIGFNFFERNNILRWRFLHSQYTDIERQFILENY